MFAFDFECELVCIGGELHGRAYPNVFHSFGPPGYDRNRIAFADGSTLAEIWAHQSLGDTECVEKFIEWNNEYRNANPEPV